MPELLNWKPEKRRKFLMNGELCEQSALTHPTQNRAFQYGDGFFETIRVCYGRAQFLEFHWDRIQASLSGHRINQPTNWNFQTFQSFVESLIQANHITEGGRLRLSFFRAAGGRYTPETNDLVWIGEIEPLESNSYTLNEKGIAVDVYPEMKKLIGPLANFKNLSAVLYVQAALWAQNEGLEDALVTNTTHNIIESTRSNLFLVSNRVLYTPGLDSGPVGGVMRAAIINLAIAEGYKVYECNISPQEMLRADELFLTNAIRGIQWVARYRTKRYFNSTAKELIGMLNQGVSSLS
jgi:branched-subunit amino acid aminotransferase/4-amino-4-deoxychorismate lyase